MFDCKIVLVLKGFIKKKNNNNKKAILQLWKLLELCELPLFWIKFDSDIVLVLNVLEIFRFMWINSVLNIF